MRAATIERDGFGSRCVEVILKIGSIWFRRTGMLDGSGGWSGRGESGDNAFVRNSGASGVMKALCSYQEKWRVSGMGGRSGLVSKQEVRFYKRGEVNFKKLIGLRRKGRDGLKVKGKSGR
jgi:hypothetical protein